MSEISNTRDRMGDKSNVLNTKSCPLIHYGCQEDQEVLEKKIQTRDVHDGAAAVVTAAAPRPPWRWRGDCGRFWKKL